jgi:queuine tRNA-ribosyltransferase
MKLLESLMVLFHGTLFGASGFHRTRAFQSAIPKTRRVGIRKLSVTAPSSDEDSKDDNKAIRHRQPDPQPLPSPADFPDWAYQPRDFFRFELIHQSTKSKARVGRIHTPHGIIDTPGYVAVATNAALKGVDFRDAAAGGQQLVFCNTYHLMIHPGADAIEAAGGIHQWTNRHEPFITDSGGFQVFSLAYGSVHEELASKGELKRVGKRREGNVHNAAELVSVTEDGVIFRSYRDGTKLNFTPESCVKNQKKIGADIM